MIDDNTNKNTFSNNLKRNKILFYMMLLTIMVVLGGIGYAYFSAGVSNTNHETVTADTATLSLVFEDNDSGVSGNLSLGQSITKKFTIENTGTVDTYAKINWYNLVNTYTQNSLTWVLEQSISESGTYKTIGNGDVPISNTLITEELKNGILVPVNTKYYYKLTITLNDLDVNQSSDIDANFYSYFNLEEVMPPGTAKIMNLVSGSPTYSLKVITKNVPEGATCTNTLAYDGTTDNNLRYVGENPCNYVTFNGEEAGWRIVGVMNNVDDGTGNMETRIKLIRKASLGSYSWDSSAREISNGYGINDWSQADLNNELNGDYLDITLTENTYWYNYSQNNQTGTFYINKRLFTPAQNQIDNAKWYLGEIAHNTTINASLVPNVTYTQERETTVYSGRATEWTGKVAIIYPSDYGYATAGGTTASRSSCVNTYSATESSGQSWQYYLNSDCKNNDWLKPASGYMWLLASPGSGSKVFYLNNSGYIKQDYAHATYSVLPAVYLKSETIISSGSGTETDPYVIS